MNKPKVERVTVRRVPGTASSSEGPRVKFGPAAADLDKLSELADTLIAGCVAEPWQPAAAALKQAALLAVIAGTKEGTKRVS